jgi:hypothetical protein
MTRVALPRSVEAESATLSTPVVPPGAAGGVGAARRGRKLRRDLKVLATFIRVYCDGHHRTAPREVERLKTHDVTEIYGRPLELCSACRKLLTHAFVKRTACPLDPKPMCKKCPQHCYGSPYRAQIREVMRYAGRKLVLRGRLDYLLHLLF